jgi:Protein of unknown function (DUF1579)
MQTDVGAKLAKHPPFAGISFEVGEPDGHLQRGPAHERLSACIGDWHATGKLGANGVMRCLESYSWLPGEFFIEYRFDRDVGGNKHAGAGLIGYDEARDRYFAFFVDNMGYARTYEMTIEGPTWTLTGKWERATITFEPHRNRMSAHWEHSSDGREWQLLCEYEGPRD